MSLTPHFTLTELQGDNAPSSAQARLLETARLLESVRAVLGVPLRVTSGYRDPVHNSNVGGTDGSQHVKGEAADFVPVGLTMFDAGNKLKAAKLNGTLAHFGQLIYYPPPLGGHLHISLPRGSARDGEMLVKLIDGRYSVLSSSLLAQFPGASVALGGIVALVIVFLVATRTKGG